MFKKIVTIFIVLTIIPFMCFAAESLNVYEVRMINSPKIVDIVLDWVTAADGSFTAVALSSKGAPFDVAYPVYIQFIYTDPGAAAPTDNYDLNFVSAEFPGVDILGEAAYNRDTANSEGPVSPSIDYIAIDLNKITFDVLNNIVNSGNGRIRLRCIKAD